MSTTSTHRPSALSSRSREHPSSPVGQRRVSSTLHALCYDGNKRRGNWDRVLHYLERHSTHAASKWTRHPTPAAVLEFSPLNKSLTRRLTRVPSEKLEKVGLKGEGRDSDDTPLRIAVTKEAPVQVVAALCQLFPESAGMKDVSGWIPLHHAAERCRDRITCESITPNTRGDGAQSSSVHDILRVLIASYPAGLVDRDNGGRTPLHVLFMRTAEYCSVSSVELLCGEVDPEMIMKARENSAHLESDDVGDKREVLAYLPPLPVIPNATPVPASSTEDRNFDESGRAVPLNPAIIPDSFHGCLPLHYAVMKCATVEVIRCLIDKYPASLRMGDRYGRTPLGWYLGGSLWEAQERFLELEGYAGEEKDDYESDSNEQDVIESKNCLEEDENRLLLRKNDVEHAKSLRVVNGELLTDLDFDRPAAKKRAEEKAVEKLLLHRSQRSTVLISLLLNQSVACVADRRKRLPLHFAARLFALSLLDPPEGGVFECTVNTERCGPGMSSIAHGCIASKAIKLIIDSNRRALVEPDINGHTPLHVLFATAHIWNEKLYRCLLTNEKLNGKYVSGSRPFNPPGALVKLLLQRCQQQGNVNCRDKIWWTQKGSALSTTSTDFSEYYSDECTSLGRSGSGLENDNEKENEADDCENVKRIDSGGIIVKVMSNDESTLATHVEDSWGLLPVHYAVMTASPPELISALVRNNPMSLLHTTYEVDSVAVGGPLLRSSFWGGSCTPLHAAFSSPFTAQVQTVETLETLLKPPSSSMGKTETLDSKAEAKTGRSGSSLDFANIMSVDGRLALKMEDGVGRFPLHLAAEHGASTEVLQVLLKGYEPAALAQNRNGDLPLHLLLDTNLFINIEAMEVAADLEAMGSGPSNLLDKEHSLSRYEIVRRHQANLRITSAQTARLSRKGIGGAIFGQLHGWMSDEDEIRNLNSCRDLICKIDLLLSPLVTHAHLLQAADSRHGMTPLHIAVAFHATTYDRLLTILRTCPCGASIQTTSENVSSGGYTALDLHVMRFKFDEVPADEMESWHAVRELLFSHEIYPLGWLAQRNGKINVYRRDKDLIMRCVGIIKAEAGDGKRSAHRSLSHPVDHVHIETGLADAEESPKGKENVAGTAEAENQRKNRPLLQLSPVALRLWVFLSTFTNQSDPADHYAPYVDSIIADLDPNAVQILVGMSLPDFCATQQTGALSQQTGALSKLTGLTVRDCANVYCKKVMHSTFYFAGLYDFTPPPPSPDSTGRGASILLHKGAGGHTLLLRATENTFFTAENASGDGDIETEDKQEGKHGAGLEVSAAYAIESEGGATTVAETTAHNKFLSNFQVTTRAVCIKFIRDRKSYEREVHFRSLLGVQNGGITCPIMPILYDYNATGNKRKGDKNYARDLKDPRFQKLPLFSHPVKDCPDVVDISQYPYAIVLPLSTESDLGSSYLRRGLDDPDDIKELSLSVGQSLSAMHKKNIIHCNISMNNIISFHQGKGSKQCWIPTDLTCSSQVMSFGNNSALSTYPGEISCNGVPYFASGIYPPEMFTKLGPKQLSIYNKYWNAVMQMDGVTIDSDLVSPWIDSDGKNTYVMKCHCNVGTEFSSRLPQLPYGLIPPNRAVDLWSFGVLLFTLCSGGHSLFPTNSHTGNLSSLSLITKWNKGVAERIICDQIKDPIAQDILLHLLAPAKVRASLTFDTVLKHPFFTKESDVPAKTRQMLYKIAERRKQESREITAQIKKKIETRRADDNWVEERTVRIGHPNLDLQIRMMHSASELIRVVFHASSEAPGMPYCFIVLPYKLIRDKLGKLIPSSKKDVNVCEYVGRLALSISKACVFVRAIEAGWKDAETTRNTVNLWANSCSVNHEEAAKKILSFVGLNTAFLSLASAYVSYVKAGREYFLSDPLYMARKLIHGAVKELLSVYAKSGSAYLYMVDEFNGVPVVPPVEDDSSCYPQVIKNNMAKIVLKAFPFMQMCILQARGAEGDISGLVKLIFQGAYPHPPPSWVTASQGLKHRLDQEAMVSEVRILKVALEEMVHATKSQDGFVENSDKVLYEIEEYFLEFDRDLMFGNLKCVTDNKASFWTVESSIKHIEKLCDSENVLQAHKSWEAQKEALREKDARIAELEKLLQTLSFS